MISYSQAAQDVWVVDTLGPAPGWFVDVGAWDGVATSNTYALEQIGWTGICIEPNRDAYTQLCLHRHCLTTATAASSIIGHVSFDGTQCAAGAPQVPCATLAYILESAGAPPVIDYLSIDVEGHELAVLAGMDFERWEVLAITIEHNAYLEGPQRKDLIYDYLTRQGFVRVVSDVGCIDPCPPPAWCGCPFEDFYLNRRLSAQT